MTAPTAPATSSPTGPDWKDQAVDTIESVVGTIRDKTTVPAITAARALVYGLVMLAVGALVLVLLVIGLFRVADAYLIGWAGRVDGQRRTYIPYLAVGSVLSMMGLLFWRRRTAKS